jgi:hypothetical protein
MRIERHGSGNLHPGLHTFAASRRVARDDRRTTAFRRADRENVISLRRSPRCGSPARTRRFAYGTPMRCS